MRKCILVTGGAGFIGSHLVDLLIREGNQVKVLDNFSTGTTQNLSQVNSKQSLEIVEGSILNLDEIEYAMRDCDVVFHLAVECVRRSLSQPISNHHANATGTLNVLEVARKLKIKRFVYCSSSEVYGNCEDKLLNETTSKCQPTTVYGAAKLSGEFYSKAYCYTYNLPVVIVRPFNAYGPRAHLKNDTAEVIPRFIIRILNNLPPVIFGNGENTRDFTYVTDIVRGLKMISECDSLIGKTINIAYGVQISLNTISEKIATLCGKSKTNNLYIDSRPGDIRYLHADTSLAERFLNYKAEINFEQGLKTYLSWFKKSYPNPAALLENDLTNWKMPA